jgi:hypothetical protein
VEANNGKRRPRRGNRRKYNVMKIKEASAQLGELIQLSRTETHPSHIKFIRLMREEIDTIVGI